MYVMMLFTHLQYLYSGIFITSIWSLLKVHPLPVILVLIRTNLFQKFLLQPCEQFLNRDEYQIP